jgi:riboflavin biosynthesis pyrimidine reductase
VLNTAVLFGRGARQLWIVDIDDATPELKIRWTNKKHIVHEEEIISKLSTILIGGDTLLRDNPPSYPVQDGREARETPAAIVSVPLPVAN